MKIIPLTQGKCALVDDGDFEWLNQWKWYAHNSHGAFYAARSVWVNGRYQKTFMHRLVAGTPDDMQTDHIDRNGLNNQRANLRICIRQQNNVNIVRHNASGYRGVYWDQKKKRWGAVISFRNQNYHLGRFVDVQDAAHAYDAKARELYGEFALTNF